MSLSTSSSPPLRPNYQDIPEQLKAGACWVLWRYEERDGKRTKVPYQPTGVRARSDDATTWTSYIRAAGEAQRVPDKWSGIGVMLLGSQLVGIDLDHCRNPETGEVEECARDIIAKLNTYTEVSPSGEGLRAFARGQLPAGARRRGPVEMYDGGKGRYLTVTGHHVEGTPWTINAADLAQLHAELFPESDVPVAGQHVATMPARLNDQELLQKAYAASNGATIQALYSGSLEGNASASEAVAALLHRLAFWTRDPGQLDRLMRSSGLFTEKWDRPQNGRTWGAIEIDRALMHVTDSYTGASGVHTHNGQAVNGNGKPKAGASNLVAKAEPPPLATHIRDLIEAGQEWLEAPDADQQTPIIQGVLATSGIAIVAGEPKTGKSWLTFSLALAVANGAPWLGKYAIETTGRVLYIATEGNAAKARQRLRGLAMGMGLVPATAMKGIDVIWRKPVAIDDSSFMAELAEVAGEYVLIIVDVLRDAWQGEENKNDDLSVLLRGVRAITNLGPTMLLVQHFSKSTSETSERRPGQRIRGGSVFHAALDSGIYLERGKTSTRTGVSLESKDDAPDDGFSFSWPTEPVDGTKAVSLEWSADEAADESVRLLLPKVAEAARANPGLSRNALAKAMGGRNRVALAAVNLAVERHLLEVRPTDFENARGETRQRDGLYVSPKRQPEPAPERDSNIVELAPKLDI